MKGNEESRKQIAESRKQEAGCRRKEAARGKRARKADTCSSSDQKSVYRENSRSIWKASAKSSFRVKSKRMFVFNRIKQVLIWRIPVQYGETAQQAPLE